MPRPTYPPSTVRSAAARLCGVLFLAAAAAALVAGCGGGSGAPPSPPARFDVVALTPLVGSSSAGVRDINDSGDIAGSSHLANGVSRATLWRAGRTAQPIDLGTLGGGDSVATGINGAGLVVGHSSRADGRRRAFRWHDGALAELAAPADAEEALALGVDGAGRAVGVVHERDADVPQGRVWRAAGDAGDAIPAIPGSNHSYPFAVSEGGIVVGAAKTSDGVNAVFRPFRHDGARTVGLNALPGGSRASAEGISGDGRLIVGWSETTGDPLRGVLWRDGRPADLGTLPDRRNSPAYDVNDRGQVVGFCGEPDRRRAYLWEDGRLLDLNDLIPADSGWELNIAVGINDRGQIIGYGTKDGREAAFLLTPR